MRNASILLLFMSGLIVFSCKDDNEQPKAPLMQLLSVKTSSNQTLNLADGTKNEVPANEVFSATFTSPIDTTGIKSSIKIGKGPDTLALSFSYSADLKTVTFQPQASLSYKSQYSIVLKKTIHGTDGSEFPGTVVTFSTQAGTLQITSFKIDNATANGDTRLLNVSLTPVIEVTFSAPVNPGSLSSHVVLGTTTGTAPATVQLANASTITITPAQKLDGTARHMVGILSSLTGTQGETFVGISKFFYTTVDPTPKKPVVSDDQLMTLVQQQTFKYFWDFGHPVSGMARERNTSGDVVTSGGSGFGLMSIIVGIERNFVTRTDGVARFNKIVTFLEKADRFHGAWSHWINGSTGKVIPFSPKDNGGDLVETSFLVQGLLSVRQYLKPADTVGNNLIRRIDKMWRDVEWSWYRKNNENVLYWHWSPNYAWDMNFPMYGYFEEQITYILAAASPTYSIPREVYTNGYGKNGAIVTNGTFYNIKLPLGNPAPLFWVQYSYLGMDPHFSDDYANYWEQNVNATLINQNYCVANPKNYPGYSAQNWGLTSSDIPNGYSANSPANDRGVITPTAALSSFPYTPQQSMDAMKFFYYNLGDKLWGDYGFYDAFNVYEGWYANSYLAIDQGPIIVMIENYRSGLLWNLFMSSPEIQQAKTVLGLH